MKARRDRAQLHGAALAFVAACAMLSYGARASAQECGCPGAEAAPPPPNTPGWEYIEAHVTASLNNALFVRASVHALITSEDGQPAFRGGYLRVTNRSRCPFWFGLSGVLNIGVMPGQTEVVPLAQYRQAGDTRPTEVDLFGVFCTASVRAPAQPTSPDRYVCGPTRVCCVPGTPAAIGQCECPLNASFVFDPPGQLTTGRCECMSSFGWDAERRECVYQESQCPAGMIYSSVGQYGRCVCPNGQRWDRVRRTCIQDNCSGGSRWSVGLNRCACPAGEEWSGSQNQCFDPGCEAEMSWNASEQQCMCPPQLPAWNAATRHCEECPGEQRWSGDRCGCPAEQPRWVERGRRCEECPGDQSWNGTECACDGAREWNGRACVCPSSAPEWNADTRQCEPCAGRWVARAQRCEPCPSGQAWDAAQGACTAAMCSPPCSSAQACVAGVCVGRGRLQITLTWDRPGDMDLHVVPPSGERIYFGHRSAAGGQLDRDDTRGTGPENIYWDAAPPSGDYTICVNPYSVSSVTNFVVTVAFAGNVERYSGVRAPGQRSSGCARGDATYVGTIRVP